MSNVDASDGTTDTTGDGKTANVSPQLLTSFAGESGAPGNKNCGRSGGTNCSYRDHPDATIAANAMYVVEATGQSITVYDTTGTLLTTTATATFLTAAGGTAALKINDPYVDWNELAQRWIVSIPTELQDFLIVSATADPRGSWSGAALTATNHGDVTMKLAHDANGEYIGEYAADGNGVLDPNTGNFAWYCFAIPAAEMTWTGSFAPLHTNKNNCGYEARPVMDHDPAKQPNAPFYFVGRTCPGGGCQAGTNVAMGLVVHRGTWTGTSIMFDSLGAGTGDRTVQSTFLYNTPVNASQGTGAAVVTVESHRVFAAEQRGPILHTVTSSGPCTGNCGAQGPDANQLAFYIGVDVSNYPTLAIATSAKLASPALAFAYPALAFDSSGNLGVTAMCTGAAQQLSLCAWAHGANDLAGVFTPPTVLFAGTQTYNCNAGATVGTGTYANAVTDGSDLWMVEQDAESATSCQWTTRIAKFALR